MEEKESIIELLKFKKGFEMNSCDIQDILSKSIIVAIDTLLQSLENKDKEIKELKEKNKIYFKRTKKNLEFGE